MEDGVVRVLALCHVRSHVAGAAAHVAAGRGVLLARVLLVVCLGPFWQAEQAGLNHDIVWTGLRAQCRQHCQWRSVHVTWPQHVLAGVNGVLISSEVVLQEWLRFFKEDLVVQDPLNMWHVRPVQLIQ